MVKFGAVFPQTEIGSDPTVVRDYIQTVEGMGFDYLLAFDHVLGAKPPDPTTWPGPYTHKDTFHEVMTLFAYAAAITERIELVTGILILPQRQAVLAARQAAQIDLLSGGRLRLGVGIGWNRVEMEGLGETFTNRGRRVEEQIEVMRLLWTQDLVEFSGKYHRLDNVGINPPPVQRPIPVWFGGYTDVVYQRAARMGDGMLPAAKLDDAPQRMDTLKRYLAENGRSPDHFGIDVWLAASAYPEPQWDHFVRTWIDLGATHIGLNTMRLGFTSLDQHLRLLEKFIAFKENRP
jgi:probable F420-dependent oxidoreductase